MIDFSFSGEVTVGDVLACIGLFGAMVGFVFAGYEFRQSALAQRASFLLAATERYFSNQEIRKFYYKIDYQQFSFGENFQGSDDERLLDSLIYTFDVIGRLVRTGALPKADAAIFGFQASRVLGNSEVCRYLEWLDKEYERFGKPTPAHGDARWLAEKLG